MHYHLESDLGIDIEQLASVLPEHLRCNGHIKVGIGDDAAMLQELKYPVISTDSHHQDIHFRFDWLEPQEVGYRAAMACLSDLAASFADPVALFINISAPHDSMPQLCEIYRGLSRALEYCSCQLAGGNTTGSPDGRIRLDLTAIGECRSGMMPRRDAGRPGDLLCTTGPLGLARCGLLALQHDWPEPPSACRSAFRAPRARFDAVAILHQAGIRACMDVSDGLRIDAERLAQASRMEFELSTSRMHLPEDVRDYCRQRNLDPDELQFDSGEDYELLFCATPEQFHSIQHQLPGAQSCGQLSLPHPE